jgi:hypothetical protein
MKSYKSLLTKTLKTSLMFTIPSSIALFLLNKELVSVLYKLQSDLKITGYGVCVHSYQTNITINLQMSFNTPHL